MRILLVCRGSAREGLGHLTRARAFARVAATAHEVEVLALVEPGLERLWDGAGFPVRFPRDEVEVARRAGELRPDVLAFDLTRFAEEPFLAARRHARLTASLSPVFEHAPRVDAFFTRAPRPPVLPGVTVFHGLAYAVFGEHARLIPDEDFARAVASPRLPVAICMGGADPENRTLAVARALAGARAEPSLRVVLGDAYAHDERALAEAAEGRELTVLRPGGSLWSALRGCALGILAGGVTGLEAARAGLPALHLLAGAEQVRLLEALERGGACIGLGLFDEALGTLGARVDALARDRSRLVEMRRAGQALLDGGGAERILRELERCLGGRLP